MNTTICNAILSLNGKMEVTINKNIVENDSIELKASPVENDNKDSNYTSKLQALRNKVNRSSNQPFVN